MHPTVSLALGAVLALAAKPTAAGENVLLGVRGGFASTVNSRDPIGLGNLVPFWLEAGYSVSSHVVAGGYFQYAAGLESSCARSVTCSGRYTRVGAEVLVYLLREGLVAPWVGASAGVAFGEATLHGVQGLGATPGTGVVINISDPKFSSRSYELALQLGGDVRVGQRVAIGPYATLGTTRSSSADPVTRAEGGIRVAFAM